LIWLVSITTYSHAGDFGILGKLHMICIADLNLIRFFAAFIVNCTIFLFTKSYLVLSRIFLKIKHFGFL